MRIPVWLGLLAAAAFAQTVVLDRIAVTVNNDVITDSEVEQEIRVTAFPESRSARFQRGREAAGGGAAGGSGPDSP